MTHDMLYGKNADRYRLALVTVSPEGPSYIEVCSVDPFGDFDLGDFAADQVGGDWTAMWARGGAPQ